MAKYKKYNDLVYAENYEKNVLNIMERIFQENKERIFEAAEILLDTEKKGGKIYTFGTGHSYMPGQDIYGRAGSYAKIYPILEPELTTIFHPTKSTAVERSMEYADILEKIYPLKEGDTIIAASNSGRNKLVVEYLTRQRKKGVKVIAITSLAHSKGVESRHPSGKRLFEIANVYLDTLTPKGDATTELREDLYLGPVSTISSCYLSHLLVGSFVEIMVEEGMEPDVFKSSNLDKIDEYNQVLYEKYLL